MGLVAVGINNTFHSMTGRMITGVVIYGFMLVYLLSLMILQNNHGQWEGQIDALQGNIYYERLPDNEISDEKRGTLGEYKKIRGSHDER